MQIKHSRWLITFIAFCGLIICILDRSALSYAIKPLEAQFHLNNAQFGLLSSAFSVGYLIMVFSGGFLVNSFGAKKVWSITGVVWSIATLLMGLSTGLIMIFLLRFICGAAEGPTGPCIMKSVTTWLPNKEHSRALALVIAANPFSSVIGAPLCTFLLVKFNWEMMFFILGLAGVIWAIVWALMYNDNPEQSKFTTVNELEHIKHGQVVAIPVNATVKVNQSWTFIIKSRTLLLNNYAFFAFGYLLFFGLSWLPGYLMQQHAINLKELGNLLMLPWLAATVAMLVCGFLSDWLLHKTASLRISRSIIIGVSLILSALSFLPVVISSNMIVIFTFLSLALGLGLGPSSCFYAINSDIAKNKAAISAGIMVACLAIAGIIAPIITGYLSNFTGNFNSAIYIMLAINISAGLLVVLFQNPDKEVGIKLHKLAEFRI